MNHVIRQPSKSNKVELATPNLILTCFTPKSDIINEETISRDNKTSTLLSSMKISSDKFNNICEFMIDSGSSVNLIKIGSLNNPAIVTENNLTLRS